MSVEFRQRKPAEYGRILWRRRWLIALPAAAIFFAIAVVVWRLPNVYQSTTLLVVRPSSLAQGIVPQLSDDDLTIRINNIAQEVFSRSSLEPLIVNNNLYAAERRRGASMEMLVERMAKQDTKVEVSKSRNDITNGFQISFKASSPVVAQQVTSALASKYVNAQAKGLTEQALQTQSFINQQLQQSKADLDAIDKQRIQYMMSNIGNLPSSTGALVQRLTGLYEQQKSFVTEIGRLRDQQTLLTTQLGDIEKNVQIEKEEVVDTLTDPKTTPAWAQLSQRESQLESELQAMIAGGLRQKNPDVVAKKQEVAAVQHEKQELIDDWKNRVEEKRQRVEKRIDPRITTLRGQLQYVQGEIGRQEKLLEQTRAAVGDLEGRINKVPAAEVGLSALDREYQTKKATYDELLEKKQKSDLAYEASKAAQGESIQVIDPASLPEQPVAPKRPLLLALGLALGLAVGLLFAAAFEVPSLLTIQTVEDARHYTNLPVLITVPELLTPREQRRRKVRGLALAMASLALAVASVPALALLLKMSGIFERFAT